MTTPVFDHDRLDVYRLAIEYVSATFVVAKQLDGHHRHARDQWLRAAQSIPLNIAEGNGELKRSLKRIVSMLTRLIARADAVSEPGSEYEYRDAEYEYRDAEYEYDGCAEPELSRPPEPGLRPSSNGQSIFPAR